MSELSFVTTGTVPLLLPDAASTAALVISEAMEYCARKMGLGSAQAAVDALKQGSAAACSYCHYHLAQRVAASLGALDERIWSVYLFQYDEDPEAEDGGGRGSAMAPLHLIARVEGKSSTLTSLAEGLDRALVAALVDLIGISPSATVLDVHFVDDRDIERRIGYGALLSALHSRPIKVWER
jgi:hypothetical protein